MAALNHKISTINNLTQSPKTEFPVRSLYQALLDNPTNISVHKQANTFVQEQLLHAQLLPCDLPENAYNLEEWQQNQLQETGTAYQCYLLDRKNGSPRRFFPTKAHALLFLQHVAPTKCVDGAWLYGLLNYWDDPRANSLIRTYLDELGNGNVQHNHVVIFQQLLATEGIINRFDLPDEFYVQGSIQQALGFCAEQYLPEIIGFNLGYEQLPLHLMITTYELNELGIDPYYFSLHITIDNAGSGHAQQAIHALHAMMPIHDQALFYRRVRDGYRLNQLGRSTEQIIRELNLEQAVIAVFTQKAKVGQFAHSSYCRFEGQSVNEWLSQSEQIPNFIETLQTKGWIKRHQAPEDSRFWQMITGDKAAIFGVFTKAEQQIIHDWISGEHHSQHTDTPFRRQKLTIIDDLHSKKQINSPIHQAHYAFDSDITLLAQQLRVTDHIDDQRIQLIPYLSTKYHPTPVGIWATQQFLARLP